MTIDNGVSNFVIALYTSPFVYVAILSSSFLVNLLLYSRYFFSPIDPFVVSIFIPSTISLSGVVFIFTQGINEGSISLDYFLLSFVSFTFGVLSISLTPRRIEKAFPHSSNINVLKTCFAPYSNRIYLLLLTVAFLLVISSLATYQFAGIPLLADSRFDVFQQGGGLGILSRICSTYSNALAILLPLCFYLSPHSLSKRLICVLSLLTYCILGFLSGSRGFIIPLLFSISNFSFFLLRAPLGVISLKRLSIGKSLVFVPSIILATAIVAFLAKESTQDNPLFGIFYRLLMTSDAYYHAFASSVVSSPSVQELAYDNPLTVILRDVLGLLRIDEWSNLPRELGNIIVETVYGYQTTEGANPGHTLFGHFYFGIFGGPLFSFLAGFLAGISRSKSFISLLRSSPFAYVMTSSLIAPLLSFYQNPSYCVSSIVNIAIFLLPLCAFAVPVFLRTRAIQ